MAREGSVVRPEHSVPTHDLVAIQLKGVGDWPTVRVAKQPPPLPATRPVGPRAEPPDWSDTSLAVRVALAEATGSFHLPPVQFADDITTPCPSEGAVRAVISDECTSACSRYAFRIRNLFFFHV